MAKNQPDSELPAELASPAIRALVGAGYTRVEQLNGVSEKKIKDLHGVGPSAIKKLKIIMAEKGLSFAEK